MLYDAAARPALRRALLDAVARAGALPGAPAASSRRCRPRRCSALDGAAERPRAADPAGAEQSNTLGRLRRPLHPEAVPRARGASTPTSRSAASSPSAAASSTSPPSPGALEYRGAGGRAGDARASLHELRPQRGRRLAATRSTRSAASTSARWPAAPATAPPRRRRRPAARARRRGAAAARSRERDRLLPRVGRACSASAPPSCTSRSPRDATIRRFAPGAVHRRSTSARCTSRCAAAPGRTLRLLRRRCPALTPSAAEAAERLLARRATLLERFQRRRPAPASTAMRIRVPRRLPPGPGAVHRPRLRDHRLRGRAGAAARASAASSARRCATSPG